MTLLLLMLLIWLERVLEEQVLGNCSKEKVLRLFVLLPTTMIPHIDTPVNDDELAGEFAERKLWEGGHLKLERRHLRPR